MSVSSPERWQTALLNTALRAGEAGFVDVMILKAVFGWNGIPVIPPAYGPSCVITPDGYVLTNFASRRGAEVEVACIGHVEQFVDNMRRLSDHAQIDDDERIAFFAELRKWVRDDNRPASASEQVTVH